MDLEDLLRTQSREGGSRLYGSVPDIGSFGLGTAAPPPPPMPGAVDQGQDPRRREKPGYRPLDLQKLELLQKYAALGLDPSFLAPFASEVTGSLDQRLADYRAKQQARKASLQSLSTLGPQAAELVGSGVPADAVDDMFQGFGGRVERGLDDIIGQTAAAGVGGEADTLNPESVQGIAAHATDLLAQNYPLHNARMVIIGQLRAQGFGPGALQEAYDLIGQQYSAAPAASVPIPDPNSPGESFTLLGNTPLTMQERLARLTAATSPPQPTAEVPAPSYPPSPLAGGGIGSPFGQPVRRSTNPMYG